MEENKTWKEENRKRAEERVRAVEAAQERIDALIARAGSPVMIVKSGEQYRFANRMKEIDGIARSKAKELEILESNAFINALYDEIKVMDEQITDMSNTIDRLEAALYNTLNERNQLLADLKTAMGNIDSCEYCMHENKRASECNGCSPEIDQWEWRGIQEANDDDA